MQHILTPQVVLMVKNPSASAGNGKVMGLILGWGRSPGGGHGNPLQYSSLEDPHGWRSLVGYSPLGHKKLDNWSNLACIYAYSTFYVSLGHLYVIFFFKLRIVFYFVDKTEDLNLRHGLSDNSEGLLQRGKGGARMHKRFHHKDQVVGTSKDHY